jgi:hypothetical protein
MNQLRDGRRQTVVRTLPTEVVDALLGGKARVGKDGPSY